MNWTLIAQSVEGILALAKEVAPALAFAGPAGTAAASIISSGATIATNALAAATAAGTAVSTQNLASLQASAAALQEQNALLAEQIAGD